MKCIFKFPELLFCGHLQCKDCSCCDGSHGQRHPVLDLGPTCITMRDVHNVISLFYRQLKLTSKE